MFSFFSFGLSFIEMMDYFFLMEKTHDSDLVFMFVRPKFRLLES